MSKISNKFDFYVFEYVEARRGFVHVQSFGEDFEAAFLWRKNEQNNANLFVLEILDLEEYEDENYFISINDYNMNHSVFRSDFSVLENRNLAELFELLNVFDYYKTEMLTLSRLAEITKIDKGEIKQRLQRLKQIGAIEFVMGYRVIIE